MTGSPPCPTPDNHAEDARETPRVIEVGTLLGAAREVTLLHNGEAYRLRITANNKLILTK